MSNDFYVYALLRPNGLPCYVGKGRGDRLNFHMAAARHGKHWNRHLQNIINQAGGSLPLTKLKEGLTEEEAFAFEKECILSLGREPNGPLVNLSDGGEGPCGLKFSDESKAKMRETAIRIKKTPPSQKGVKQSAETIERRRAKLIGRKMSEEHKAKLIEINKKRVVSEETREKMRQAKLGTKQSPETIEKRMAHRRGEKRPAEWGAKISAAKLGHKVSEETRRKISEAAIKRHALKLGER